MIEYSHKNAKRWSVLGERPTFGLAVLEMAKDDADITVVTADTVNSAGLERMKNLLPEQIVNVGIAEQNMMGIATGLASEGYKVFTTTFAPFQAMRCLEQIRVNQGYMGEKVVMVGLASGVAYGELGHTHCSLEDVAILRSIPNISVVVPADCMAVAKAVEAACAYDKSVYIRLLDKTNLPIVYEEDYEFCIGKANRVVSGTDINILANGTMVYPAVKAAEELKQKGISCAVYDMHTVKPIDKELLDGLCKENKPILTVEEHYLIGGLGSAVSEYVSDKAERPCIYKMGVPDEFCHGASHETILEKYALTTEGIINKISKIMEEVK